MRYLIIFSVALSVYSLPTLNRQTAGRIVGGAQANAGQWPWAAAVHITTSNGNYFCGGALLNPDFVLTAAQCVVGAILFTITLGSNKLQGDSLPTTTRVATETYFIHPDYNPNTLESDIALIQFRETILYGDYILRAYLPYSDMTPGYTGTAIGWGHTTDSDLNLNSDLHWVELVVLDNAECKIYYGNQITDNMLCAQGNYNEGTCIGDTGGPLTQYISRGYNVVVGVSSFVSSSGCESAHPSGYTRVFPHNDWINNITKEA